MKRRGRVKKRRAVERATQRCVMLHCGSTALRVRWIAQTRFFILLCMRPLHRTSIYHHHRASSFTCGRFRGCLVRLRATPSLEGPVAPVGVGVGRRPPPHLRQCPKALLLDAVQLVWCPRRSIDSEPRTLPVNPCRSNIGIPHCPPARPHTARSQRTWSTIETQHSRASIECYNSLGRRPISWLAAASAWTRFLAVVLRDQSR